MKVRLIDLFIVSFTICCILRAGEFHCHQFPNIFVPLRRTVLLFCCRVCCSYPWRRSFWWALWRLVLLAICSFTSLRSPAANPRSDLCTFLAGRTKLACLSINEGFVMKACAAPHGSSSKTTWYGNLFSTFPQPLKKNNINIEGPIKAIMNNYRNQSN